MSTNKLKGKIVEAGFTQRSLALEIGMSKNTLNSKVNGKIPFNTIEIEAICEKLGITDPAEKALIFYTNRPKNGTSLANQITGGDRRWRPTLSHISQGKQNGFRRRSEKRSQSKNEFT